MRTKLELAAVVEGLRQAKLAAESSPDPFKKVGIAAIAGYDVVATGYNHVLSRGNKEFWEDRVERRKFIIHAEVDLMSRISINFPIDIVVTTLFPCVHCMTLLASRGVQEVLYCEIYDKDMDALAVAAFYGIKCGKLV